MIQRALFAIVFSFSVLVHAADLEFPFVPDNSQTTGSICVESDPDFTEYRYDEEIPYCARNVSSALKTLVYRSYGVPERCRKEYTVDHFIPLSLGGTNHRDNLWPEHKSVKALRQNLENDLYKRLSKGDITQDEAIRRIRAEKLSPPVQDPEDFSFCN